MKIINLRLYYPRYEQDKLVEVSEEVFDAQCQSVREMRNYERRKRYHRAVYSLDAYGWTKNYVLERLAQAITHLSPTQARRLHIRYALKKKFREIAADEGISGNCASDSVTGALKKLQKILLNRKRSEERRERVHRLIEREANIHHRKEVHFYGNFSLSHPDNSTEPRQIRRGRCCLSER